MGKGALDRGCATSSAIFHPGRHRLSTLRQDHAADPKAMKVVTKILEQNPTFTSSECHAVAKEAGKACTKPGFLEG
jgi:hypothetical protein